MSECKNPAGSFLLIMYQEYLKRWRPKIVGRRITHRKADSILKTSLTRALRRKPLSEIALHVYDMPRSVTSAVNLVRGNVPARYDDNYIRALFLSVAIRHLPEVELAKFIDGHLTELNGDLSWLFDRDIDHDPRARLDRLISFRMLLDDDMPQKFWPLEVVEPLLNSIRVLRAEKRMLDQRCWLAIVGGIGEACPKAPRVSL